MKNWILICGMLLAASSFAKLPELSAEAKAKAEEAKAKAAWSDKVAAFQLCKAQDMVVAKYKKNKAVAASSAATAGVVTLPACTDPGPYVAATLATAAAPPAVVVAAGNAAASKK